MGQQMHEDELLYDYGYFYHEMDELFMKTNDTGTVRIYHGREARHAAAFISFLYKLGVLKGLNIDNMHIIRYKRDTKTVVQLI